MQRMRFHSGLAALFSWKEEKKSYFRNLQGEREYEPRETFMMLAKTLSPAQDLVEEGACLSNFRSTDRAYNEAKNR
jgi:hypothetical protein